MRLQKIISVVFAAFLMAGLVAADTKIVKKVHQDGFSAMGQEQPPQDHEQVVWMGEGRMRMDQGTSSSIVRIDLKKLFLLNHDRKIYYQVDLPIELEKILPPESGSHLVDMMRMEVSVTPSDETREVGPWKARRYDLEMTSAMMSMKSIVWASQDTGIELEEFQALSAEMMKMQPGMDELVEKMSLIEGFIVAQEGRMTMPMLGDTEVGSSETTSSIEEMKAPEGLYDPPADYSLEEFDFTQMMQGR